MKWIFVWFGAASLVVAAAAGSCSINHRSPSYECDTNQDCDTGRTCSEGLCVTSGGTDGGVKPPDATVCPAQCTSCTPGKVCVIDCSAGANCSREIACPAGFHCDLRCNVDGACRSGVSCTGALSCSVQCSGRSACRNLTCGAGPCSVNCSGSMSCESVFCGTSCACDVRCAFAASCFNVLCTRPECDPGRGCSATAFPICDTCP